MTIPERLRNALEELWIWLFAWIPTPVGIAIRLFAWRWFFERCGSVRFGTALSVIGMSRMSLGSRCRIGRLSFLSANSGRLVVDDEVAISPCVHIGADNGTIIIGKNVAIGPGTVMRAANHKFGERDRPIMDQGHKAGNIVIEDDVWIGANCVILPDVRIGRGAVVGAGAVITRNVSPFTIVGGVPARPIGYRGDPARQ